METLAVLPERASPRVDSEVAVDVERALTRLSRRQREAVDLHYLAGLTVVEAATVMGCSPGTGQRRGRRGHPCPDPGAVRGAAVP